MVCSLQFTGPDRDAWWCSFVLTAGGLEMVALSLSTSTFSFSFFFTSFFILTKDIFSLLLEREEGGQRERKRGRERQRETETERDRERERKREGNLCERNIDWLPPLLTPTRDQPATWISALNLSMGTNHGIKPMILVYRTVLQPNDQARTTSSFS